MAAACDRTLWRNRDGYEHPADELAPGQAGLYAILRRKVADADDLVQPPEMPQGWRANVTAEKADPSRVR